MLRAYGIPTGICYQRLTDYGIVYANPSDKLMQVLEENTDTLYMYFNCLPDSVFEYKKATIDELIRTRIIVLRAANKLSDGVMFVLENESYAYYKRALETGEHIAYLVYDNGTFIGAGGVSFYQVMPTYHNTAGKNRWCDCKR